MHISHSYKMIRTPVGILKLIASDKGLVAVLWPNDNTQRTKLTEGRENKKHPILLQAEKQIQDYFGGKLKKFSVPLDMKGTDFQKRVWKALLKIPYGRTKSYGELASQIGSPLASRAVGMANGRNPISIIVPCHRVIGANGKLTGFAGGLEVKAQLLHLEKR